MRLRLVAIDKVVNIGARTTTDARVTHGSMYCVSVYLGQAT
jgi:hypothetical protein